MKIHALVYWKKRDGLVQDPGQRRAHWISDLGGAALIASLSWRLDFVLVLNFTRPHIFYVCPSYINREERIEKCQVNISHRNKQLQAMALEKAIYSHIQQQQEQQSERLVLPHDEASLDEQLRRLQNRLTQQRLRRHTKRSSQATHVNNTQATPKDDNTPRSQILLACLGQQRYLRLQSLLEQFQHLGVAQSCCGPSCSDGRRSSSTSPRTLQGHTQVPPPVRQLFFQTRLLSTVHHTPIHQLQSITHWDELLDEAERHMKAYQAWLQQYDGRGSCCLLVHELCDTETTSALLRRTDATEDG